MSTSDIKPFATVHASELASKSMPLAWLADGLLPCGAAAILGGPPKSGKSFLALDLCVAVASGTACAGRFEVPYWAPVLLLSAEDPEPVVTSRLRALAQGRGRPLGTLPLEVITDFPVRLPDDIERLAATVEMKHPGLLLLDPLIRLHRADENSAGEMSVILDGLRALARASKTAILLVHHTRKAPAGNSSGLSFRGSSDLAAFGDTNLYLRKLSDDPVLELRIEQRAIQSPAPFKLRLTTNSSDQTARFHVLEREAGGHDATGGRVLALLQRSDKPMTSGALRENLGVRNQIVANALRDLLSEGRVRRSGRDGWSAVAAGTP